MTAVANPPDYERKVSWQSSPTFVDSTTKSIYQHPDPKVQRMLTRKSVQRTNSSSSISSMSSLSSSASNASTDTFTTTKPLSQMNGGLGPAFTQDNTNGPPNPNTRIKKAQKVWPNNKSDTVSTMNVQTRNIGSSIMNSVGTASLNGSNGMSQSNDLIAPRQAQGTAQQTSIRQATQSMPEGNPLLYLLSMNGTFERKTISVPLYPDVLRIGRQTNQKTLPTPLNGFFDSKVLSRQHAEIWAERNGKVWIRDVRSSNGTFVNGTRLSAENRDSEPHELQSQDHLELGIDIVSEDQKTVVHHKVAAKVEHAGFLGPTKTILDMSFGDLDPAQSASMVPTQNGAARGRTNSQTSINNSGRIGLLGNAITNNLPSELKRPMNFWLTPVTTESIVKRLQHEMREARRQNVDLEHAALFVNQLAEGVEVKSEERMKSSDAPKPPQLNGGSLSLKRENIPRFGDPPAPPPKQPLPEKPDMPRLSPSDPQSPSMRRSYAERQKSIVGTASSPSVPSPSRLSPDLQMTSLVEALQQARKEIDAQTSKVRNLENLLQQERHARETAEGIAKSLETAHGVRIIDSGDDSTIILDVKEVNPNSTVSMQSIDENPNTSEVETATTKLQQKLDQLLSEMRDMKQHMEAYRQRAETAETERDESRRTLAQMVTRIREDSHKTEIQEAKNRITTVDGILCKHVSETSGLASHMTVLERSPAQSTPVQSRAALRPANNQDELLYHSIPYASMIGVVLLGMGIMAYLNGTFPKK